MSMDIQNILDQLTGPIITEGILSKEVNDLSNDQKFAICLLAGVEMDNSLSEDPNVMQWTTKNPVGIAKIDGRFVVYERRLP